MTARSKQNARTGHDGHPLLAGLGAKVRALRGERGFTRRSLADQSGLSERFVADLEAGRANISVVNLAEVARVLRVSLPSLLSHAEAGDGAEGRIRSGVISLLGLRGAG